MEKRKSSALKRTDGMGFVSPCLSSCRQLPPFKVKRKEREENGTVLLRELGQTLLPFWDVSAFPAVF